MEFPNRWFLGCRYGGCSCHFRNLLRENPPEFGAPEEWFPEDPDDIDATAAFYDLVSRLIAEGHQVDTVTVWTGDYPFDSIWTRVVCLDTVSRQESRFIDQHRFRFIP